METANNSIAIHRRSIDILTAFSISLWQVIGTCSALLLIQQYNSTTELFDESNRSTFLLTSNNWTEIEASKPRNCCMVLSITFTSCCFAILDPPPVDSLVNNDNNLSVGWRPNEISCSGSKKLSRNAQRIKNKARAMFKVFLVWMDKTLSSLKFLIISKSLH